MRIALVSTYELGHQPLHVASPAAALGAAGHDVRTIDLAVEPWDAGLVDWADAIAFSVPMHTAMRIALKGAAAAKAHRPDIPVCFYGLYGTVPAEPGLVDLAIAGEYEAALLDWANSRESREPVVDLRRERFSLPVRTTLPALERYARLSIGGSERVAGYVEASHGCVHRCRHCPVPVVYDGRTRRVDAELVVEDASRQIASGARHITFGDPDFLNRWAHSMKIVEMLHQRHPDVTFDITTKVSHLLRYESLIPLLAQQGCLFVVSAFECVNDEILRYLDKGHTRADAARVISLLRDGGLEPRPSWLPFMPWTTVDDVVAICDFIIEHDLVSNVDPVQLTIRLLIPEGSLMLRVPEMQPYLGAYDPETLSYRWTAADERTVDLQQRLASLVEAAQNDGRPNAEIFCDICDVVFPEAGRPPVDRASLLAGVRDVPRLTEPWFCCAEPTQDQFALVGKAKGI